MGFETAQQAIRTEIERARAAWSAYPLLVDYENREDIDLSKVTEAYLTVDIVYREGQQLSLGLNPLVADRGQIMVAAGAKAGTGTAKQMRLLDHFRPYLQLRDNLGEVRTHAAQAYPGVAARGFYFIPMVVGFWIVAPAPTAPP
mgnify:FL=1